MPRRGRPRGRALCIGVEAEDDARTFAGIATASGFEVCGLLRGEQASHAAVRACIDEIARLSEPGDLALITFSGHGGRSAVRVHGGAAEEVGVWHLYDGSLNDEQVMADFGRFRPGVRVVVISDNCSGGLPSRRRSELSDSIVASVLVFASCQPGDYADGAGLPGHFTQVLKNTWNEGTFAGSYAEFHRALCQRMPEYQRPDFYRVGVPDAGFEAQRPFSI